MRLVTGEVDSKLLVLRAFLPHDNLRSQLRSSDCQSAFAWSDRLIAWGGQRIIFDKHVGNWKWIRKWLTDFVSVSFLFGFTWITSVDDFDSFASVLKIWCDAPWSCSRFWVLVKIFGFLVLMVELGILMWLSQCVPFLFLVGILVVQEWSNYFIWWDFLAFPRCLYVSSPFCSLPQQQDR